MQIELWFKKDSLMPDLKFHQAASTISDQVRR